jgi:plasmid replication initiation protein
MKTTELKRKYPEGRDEMNLADFPISALQRTQKSDGEGRKLDRLEFQASRYDPVSRQRVTQRVTLTSSARDGLPTPADEHVILALLYVAKHSNNFSDATVHFAPGQLFDIMGWAPNGRSYTRLRDVLRRLKSLTIRYENAWWDAVGRGYEDEVATGIVSAYRIARQVSGPRKAGTPLSSWVTWTQQFHESLQNGNLKRLDLDVFFRLQTPTAQRMYRFLDKRFYNCTQLSLDLVEFACGHVGLTDAGNVALLKRRLAPAIAELEEIGFIQKVDPSERYQKVKAGQWRVLFQSGQAPADTPPSGASEPTVTVVPAEAPAETTARPARARSARSVEKAPEWSIEAESLAAEFYTLWNPAVPGQPGPRDREQADKLVREYGAEAARAIVACLVQVARTEWPDCRSLSGALQKYLPEALKLWQGQQKRQTARQRSEAKRQQARQEQTERQTEERRLQSAWEALPEAERRSIRQEVRERLGSLEAPAVFVQRLCLEEMVRRQGNG